MSEVMKANESLENFSSPEIEQWFLNFNDRISRIKPLEIDPAKAREPFVEMERSCSSIEQKICVLHREIEVLTANMQKIAEFSSSCQFSASAANIFAADISPVESPEGTFQKMFNFVISIVRSISNWIFAFFED